MKTRVVKTSYSCFCEVCGKKYVAKYRNSQYCGPACKQIAYRNGQTEKKKAENALELQLLQQRNKENELLNEKLRLETAIQQQQNEQILFRSKLAEEENKRKQREKEEEDQRRQREEQREKKFEQQQQAISLLGNLIAKSFTK